MRMRLEDITYEQNWGKVNKPYIGFLESKKKKRHVYYS